METTLQALCFCNWDEAYLVVVVEGQRTNFTVVRVGVLLWDILKCAVRNVGIGGHGFLALSARRLAQNLLRHLPQAHGTIPGPCERQQIPQVVLSYRKCRPEVTQRTPIKNQSRRCGLVATLAQQFSFPMPDRRSLIYLKLPCCR